MNKDLRFGIVGCGLISKWHAESINLTENAKLIGVYDKNKDNALKFAEEFGCRVFQTYDDMLASDEVDAVCICTPSGLHTPLAIMATKNKKHIVLEKPMAITRKQADELIKAVEESNVKLAVISQMRFSPDIQKVKRAIESNDLGDLIMGNLYMQYYRSDEYYSSSEWRGTYAMDGGGALMNQGIHGVDILQYLMGDIRSVSALCKTMVRNIEVEDTACIAVEYENGAIGTIQATTSVVPGYPRKIEICGTKGTIVLEESRIIRWDVNGETLPADKVQPFEAVGHNDPQSIGIDKHQMQIEDFVKAVTEDRKPFVDVYEGRKAVDIILAAYESEKLNKRVKI